MEDFDYIDSLAKSELSSREAMPSSDGWNIVQEKLQRKKKKRRLFFLLLLFVVMSSVGIYQAINFDSGIDANSVTNTNTEHVKSGNTTNLDETKKLNAEDNELSISISDSDSNSDSDSISANISQAEKDALSKNDDGTQINHQAINTLHGSEKSITSAESKVNSSASDTKNNTIYNGDENLQNDQSGTESEIEIAADEEISAETKGLQLYAWELISPEVLKKKKRKKRKKSIKLEPLYKNMDVMVGLNGFFTPNDYQVFESYVIEISYEVKRKLKNDFSFNYGAGLQFRNLRFKKDSIRFNSGELSLNLFSNIEKKYGDYSIEAGAYLGYEIYSPNNEFFNNKVKSFFDQKVNYGLSTGINYKNVGLIFKYELSPYVNYLGDKKYGGFIIGLKYDF